MGTPALILVVEDDAGIRHMLSLALESLGHRVRAADGRGRIDATDVDAVVMDLRLGERTALDLLGEQPELRDRPLIITTADLPRAVHESVGDAVVLHKPFDLETLESALARALAQGTLGPGRP